MEPVGDPIKVPSGANHRSKNDKRKRVDFASEGKVVEIEEDGEVQEEEVNGDGNLKFSKKAKVDAGNENFETDTSSVPHQAPAQSFDYYNSAHCYPPLSKEMLDEAQQAMLMAWYQSGYATGRYQLLCEIAAWNGNYNPEYPSDLGTTQPPSTSIE